MPPRNNNKNGKKEQNSLIASKYKQDIAGILLIAFSIILLMSNLSSQSSGFVGLYIVKMALRSVMGVGVYVLPFFIAAYGIIMLMRHEVKELRVRLTGLLIMFFVFVSLMQFLYPEYFGVKLKPDFIKGAGGMIGYALKFAMEKIVGTAGSYVIILAFGIIAGLLLFNLTARSLLAFIYNIFKMEDGAMEKQTKKQASQAAAIKEVEKAEKEISGYSIPLPISQEQMQLPPEPEHKPVIEFPLPKFESDIEPGISTSKGKGTLIASDGPHQSYAKYKLPPIDLLDDPSPKEKKQSDKMRETTELRKKLLEEALHNFGVGARVVSIFQGPAVTRFELQPDPGVKVSRIANLSDDIALNLAAQGVRIEAPVPGKSVVGIEVPNATISPVHLKEIVKTNEFKNNPSKLLIGIGKDLAGLPIYGDLSKMPHLLIAGTTGSGKSVAINSIIVSILLRARPDEVKMLMIDPKMVELSIYDGIAHLLAPVVTDPRRASVTLKEWVIKEMERRYKLFHDASARNLQSYNHKLKDDEEKLPHIVVIIDELADLMMVAANEVETAICRIAQLARATGIHLVVATQRPSVDVITGLIKANIPSRIAFAVATQIDSRVILDMSGAEKLLGRGDMLYNPIGAMKPTRVQGSFLTDKETERIIDHVREQAEPEYLEEIVDIRVMDLGKDDDNGKGNRDALFTEVANLIVESGQASTSYIQRKFRIGYNRAARIMDEMEAVGIVTPPDGELKTRKVLASREMLATLNK
ncbi:MAG: DNA translocase FtsK 4TM domain-containing protein [Candidatus Margulisiibacteriota bacterium]